MRENRKRRKSELFNIEINKKEIALEGGLPEPAEIEILCQKEKRKIKRKNKKEENEGEEISSKLKKEIKIRKRRRKIGKEIKFG